MRRHHVNVKIKTPGPLLRFWFPTKRHSGSSKQDTVLPSGMGSRVGTPGRGRGVLGTDLPISQRSTGHDSEIILRVHGGVGSRTGIDVSLRRRPPVSCLDPPSLGPRGRQCDAPGLIVQV